jgi:hypothetical protein
MNARPERKQTIMAIKEDARARAPRGTKNVTQAFFTALEGVPENQQEAVASAALAGIRDEVKARRLKRREAAVKAKAKTPTKRKAPTSRAAAPAATRRAPAAASKPAAAKKAPARRKAAAKPGRRKSPGKAATSPAPETGSE